MPLVTNATIKNNTSIPKASSTGGSVFQSYQSGIGATGNNAANIGAGILPGEPNPATTTTTSSSNTANTGIMQTGTATVLDPLNFGIGKKPLIIGLVVLAVGIMAYFVFFRKKK